MKMAAHQRFDIIQAVGTVACKNSALCFRQAQRDTGTVFKINKIYEIVIRVDA